MDDMMLVFSSAVGGRDEEFNDWYDRIHVPEVLEESGMTSARRYVAGPGVLGRPAPPHRYLALFDLGPDPEARLAPLVRQEWYDRVTPSPTNDPASLFVWRYRAL